MLDSPTDAEPQQATADGHAPWRSAWPAYVCAVTLLVYAGMKATYAIQGKLGLPGGRVVPPEVYEELGHVALRQSALAAMGLGGAVLALASVQAWGRHIPRLLMVLALWAALVPMLAGVPYLLQNIVAGSQPLASRLFGGVQSIVGLGLWGATTVLYQRRSRAWRTRDPRSWRQRFSRGFRERESVE